MLHQVLESSELRTSRTYWRNRNIILLLHASVHESYRLKTNSMCNWLFHMVSSMMIDKEPISLLPTYPNHVIKGNKCQLNTKQSVIVVRSSISVKNHDRTSNLFILKSFVQWRGRLEGSIAESLIKSNQYLSTIKITIKECHRQQLH